MVTSFLNKTQDKIRFFKCFSSSCINLFYFILISIVINCCTIIVPVGYKTDYSDYDGMPIIPGNTKAIKTRIRFELIEEHVSNSTSENEEILKKLSIYLSKPARNQAEVAYAIFLWVTSHIEYDYNAEDLSAEGVLASRKSVCSGYSSLYANLARRANLQCVKISGLAKGFGYRAGKDIREFDHAWNAVKLDGEWYLLDSTWGGKDEFFDSLKVSYFLTEPNIFVTTHFPEQEKWQLLPKPISMPEFLKMEEITP